MKSERRGKAWSVVSERTLSMDRPLLPSRPEQATETQCSRTGGCVAVVSCSL